MEQSEEKENAVLGTETQERQSDEVTYIDDHGNKYIPFPKGHPAASTSGGGGMCEPYPAKGCTTEDET